MSGRWPRPVQQLADAVATSVGAAQLEDAESYLASLPTLLRQEPDHLRLMLGEVVRTLVESRFPDGIDADDARQLLADTVRWVAGWDGPVDVPALAAVLTGSLGVHPDDADRPDVAPDAVSAAAPLLAAHLLAGRSAQAAVDRALTTVAQHQENDAP